jgi:hypothetical protein
MTTIVNKYVGITHPLDELLTENEEFCKAWKISNCRQGIHAFDEVHSLEHHYLHCDVCGMEVHIKEIVIPDGKDDILEDNSKKEQS